MKKKFLLNVLAYLIPTMVLGMCWHFVFFKDVYDELRIYNRAEPIIPLGMSSMLIQGIIFAHLYPFYQATGSAMIRAMKYAMLMGLLLFTVTTLANGAKIEVSSMVTWLEVQTAFTVVQVGLYGTALGFLNRHDS